MKKETTTKKITIDTLAIMMNNGFESIKRDFTGQMAELKKDIKEEITGVKKEITGIKNQLEGTNKRIDDLASNRVKYDDHNKIKTRVDFIEEKLGIKN